MSENVAFADVLPRAGRGFGDLLVVCLTSLYRLALIDGFFKFEGMPVPANEVLWPAEASFEDKLGAGDIRDLEGSCIAEDCCERKSLSLGRRVVDALEGDLEVIADGVRDGDRTGLLPLKKLDCLLEGPGDGGIRDNVSIVRSDNEGRGRPRRSASPTAASVPSMGASSREPPVFSASPPSLSPLLEMSLFCRGFSGVLYNNGYFGGGFLTTGCSDGLRSLVASRPGSARNFSREGEGLMDLEALDVGRGSLEAASRGIALGLVGVFCCWSILRPLGCCCGQCGQKFEGHAIVDMR
jgi:hypothetical protein